MVGREDGIEIGKKQGIKIGEKRGEKRGEKKGIKAGELQNKKVVAKKLLLQKVDDQIILSATGLSKKEFEELKKAI